MQKKCVGMWSVVGGREGRRGFWKLESEGRAVVAAMYAIHAWAVAARRPFLSGSSLAVAGEARKYAADGAWGHSPGEMRHIVSVHVAVG
jgi:hypothetical protein